ncbi:MAG: rhodanese-related sulfurtransferase [Calothrix sp. SM1_7_51]|nr:rhodanese-related sulfurtransferase [Calothrix sp. SM1_7_51]
MQTIPFPTISVEELRNRLSNGDDNLQLLDVREPQEIAIAKIEGFTNYPLSEFSEWSEIISAQLDLEVETLVLCHHGIRSAQMCNWLTAQGFTNVKNISGGIDAYSKKVDSSVPLY